MPILKSMKRILIAFPILPFLLTGCTPVTLVMKEDSDLTQNAVVYKVDHPNTLSDKVSGERLKLSFADYHVSHVDLSWRGISSNAENPSPLFRIRDVKKSGDTTETTEISGGPTSLFGFARPTDPGEPSIQESQKTVNYQFNSSKHGAWRAQCVHNAKQRVTHYEQRSVVEPLSSVFTCRYSAIDHAATQTPWLLTVDLHKGITLTQNNQRSKLVAHRSGGYYQKPDGQKAKDTTATVGYTWQQETEGNLKSVAAISVREDQPRVWLNKDNDKQLNHLLSMASTGLLIYTWEIER